MKLKTIKRDIYPHLFKRMNEPRRFIQVLTGPRQIGKTTLAKQAMNEVTIPTHYVSADEPTLQDRTWLDQQWEIARLQLRPNNQSALLIVDEVQKIPGWSETVKRLWDQDSFKEQPLHVLLLGSSPLLIGKGLTESLAGRFEIIPVTH